MILSPRFSHRYYRLRNVTSYRSQVSTRIVSLVTSLVITYPLIDDDSDLTAFSHVFADTFRLSPSVKTSRVLFVPNNILLYFYNRSVARNVNSRRGPREFRSGYCEEGGALVAGLFDSFRAPVPRATFPPASDRRARTKGGCAQWRTEGERERENRTSRYIQFGTLAEDRRNSCCKTPRVELTMRGPEDSGTLPERILPATTTTTTMQPPVLICQSRGCNTACRSLRIPLSKTLVSLLSPSESGISRDASSGSLAHTSRRDYMRTAFYENLHSFSRVANTCMLKRTTVSNLIDRF